MQKLIDKYNIPVPRYTSYPPANFFHENFGEQEYKDAIIASNEEQPELLSFYFHIPFCRRLCHYCGCNSYAAPEDNTLERYVAALHKEIDLVLPLIRKNRKISQIHYGGGTPTFLPASELAALNKHVLEAFETIEKPEIAIECHAGWMNEKDWEALVEAGFNRFSLGIQDFDEKVLEAVHRKAPAMPVADIMTILRKAGASVNMDFLYGLPHQTVESFTRSIEKAVELQPDRLVTFSYAHVPWAFPRQKVLEQYGLPQGEVKSQMFESARKVLCNAGYQPIGLDHFVREDDELSIALKNGQLHRNFQGYCTRRTTGQVYAFGVTGISQLGTAYIQNTKSIPEYIEQLDNGHLPVTKGYALNKDEQITREVIEMLMCNYTIHWEELAQRLSLSVEAIKQATAYDEQRLQEFAQDGLITWDANHICMTSEGKLFVRNVAASLDKLMLKTDKSFSKPV